MLSRRAFLLSALATSTASTLARAQTAPQTGAGGTSGQPTVLRIARRSIEVNGKSASVLGIRQADGTTREQVELQRLALPSDGGPARSSSCWRRR